MSNPTPYHLLQCPARLLSPGRDSGASSRTVGLTSATVYDQIPIENETGPRGRLWFLSQMDISLLPLRLIVCLCSEVISLTLRSPASSHCRNMGPAFLHPLSLLGCQACAPPYRELALPPESDLPCSQKSLGPASLAGGSVSKLWEDVLAMFWVTVSPFGCLFLSAWIQQYTTSYSEEYMRFLCSQW